MMAIPLSSVRFEFPFRLPDMHSTRSTKSYYVAAFCLGAVIALLIVAPARSAERVALSLSPVGSLTTPALPHDLPVSH